MRTSLVRIGNSRGIRIPRALIEQYRLGAIVELVPEEGQLVLRPVEQSRIGWDEAFRQMAEHGDDQLLDKDALGSTKWDDAEWQW